MLVLAFMVALRLGSGLARLSDAPTCTGLEYHCISDREYGLLAPSGQNAQHNVLKVAVSSLLSICPALVCCDGPVCRHVANCKALLLNAGAAISYGS